ncbi:MAG: class I SAM-dependent methyltransferase [Candidatus Zixiibacteriota bacterium]
MSKVDFDNYAHSYKETLNSSLKRFGGDNTFFDSHKIYCINEWLISNGEGCDILDFGCGIGKIAVLLAKEFPTSNIYGYDISKESLALARNEHGSVKNLHFTENLTTGKKFDFIVVSGVMHHVPPYNRLEVLCKLKELLNVNGKIAVFEHNPLNPLTRYTVGTCPFDRDAKLLGSNNLVTLAKLSGLVVNKRLYILFFPWAARIFRRFESYIKKVPFGAQYMVILAKH